MTGVAGLVRRRPVLTLVVVGVPATWAVLLVPQHVRPGSVPLPALVLAATWGVLLPTALLVSAVVGGRAEVQRLVRSAVRWPPRRWAPALVALTLPTGTLLLGRLVGGPLAGASSADVAREVLVLGSALLAVHLAEEAVWTGLVQHRLSGRHPPLVAALLTAGPFAGVHLPLLVGPGATSGQVLGGLGGLVVLAVVVRLLVATVADAAACVLPAALLHAPFNATANEGRLVGAVLGEGADANLLATAVSAALVAVVLPLQRRRRRRGRPYSSKTGRTQPSRLCLKRS